MGSGRPGRRCTATILVAVFVLALLAGGVVRSAAAAGGQGSGGANPAPTGSAGGAEAAGNAPWQQVTVVVRPDPSGRGMAVLFLARWGGGGPGTAGGAALPLPSLGSAQPAGPLPEGLRWDGSSLVDGAPPAPGQSRDYAYAFVADTRATRGRLPIQLPAAVGRLVVMTVEGELVAQGEGLNPAGRVSGDQLGMAGTDLAVWAAGPLGPGPYTVQLMPPGMTAGAPGTAGGPAAGEPPAATAPGGGGGAVAGPGTGAAAVPGGWAGAAALAGAGVLLTLAGFGAARWWNSPARWRGRRRRLIEAIVELDRAFAAGDVPEAVYQEERRRLVEAAVVATRRGWAAEGGAVPAGSPAAGTGTSRGEATSG
ncbi:hypothetical protein [Thermaerobacter litoralis]